MINVWLEIQSLFLGPCGLFVCFFWRLAGLFLFVCRLHGWRLFWLICKLHDWSFHLSMTSCIYIYICIYNCFSPCPIGLSPLEWFQFLLLLSLPMIKAPNSRAQPVQNRSYECKKCKGNGSTNGKRSRAKVIGANHWAKSTCLSGPVLEVQGFKVFGIRVSGQLREG